MAQERVNNKPSRRLKHPRLFSVHIVYKTGRIVDKMLGVAFTVAERQTFYDKYRQYAHWCSLWNSSTIDTVNFVSEVMK